MAFNAAAYHDGDPVIEVGRLFSTDVPEMSARQQLGATAFDAARSFIDHISSYPENIEAEATVTYTRTAMLRLLRADAEEGSVAVRCAATADHRSSSQYGAPARKPMMPRLFDERVGYFTTAQMDYSADEYRAVPSDTSPVGASKRRTPAPLSQSLLKPIVYYLDSATPKKWVPCSKRRRGLERSVRRRWI